MNNRLGTKRKHSVKCDDLYKDSRKCLCGKTRFLWMYQPGDVLELPDGSIATYSFDEWLEKKAKIWDRKIEPYTWVSVGDDLQYIRVWTEVSEVDLYSPKCLVTSEEVDPLK